jgi:hypothetical protein
MGPASPPGCTDKEKLEDVLHKLEETSLSRLSTNTKRGSLRRCARDDAIVREQNPGP